MISTTRLKQITKRTLTMNKWRLRTAILARNGFSITDQSVFAGLINRGQTIFDIGANIGFHTLFFSQLVGRTGGVHAFEPMPSTFQTLRHRIIPENLCRNVTLNNCALGEHESESIMYQPGTDHGQSSMTPHQAGSWSGLDKAQVKTQTVKVQSLDSYIEKAKPRRVDFLKIDVEGYELMCLKGAVKTLSQWKPVIYLEVNPLWSVDFGYTPLDIARFIKSFGYDELSLLGEGNLRKVTEPDRQLGPELFCSADLLCTQKPLDAHSRSCGSNDALK